MRRPTIRLASVLFALIGAGTTSGGEPVIDHAVSRTFTIQNLPAAGELTIQDARSRIFTVNNDPAFGPELNITDARSRIFTVFNEIEPVPFGITDVQSRAFSVRNELPSPSLQIDSTQSRIFTVSNNLPSPPLIFEHVSSRAFSVLNCQACIQSPELCVALPDCNLNGFNDICELLLAVGGDCNGTGILDACDPSPCPTCLGDVNGDGRAAGDDIQLFVDLVLSSSPSPCGDVNLTGGPLDLADIGPFVCRLLSAEPACP